MKLFFDARYIRTDFHDGISRYTHELAHALAQETASTKDVEITYIICNDRQRSFLSRDTQCVMLHPTTSWKEPFCALLLNKYRPDVVASPLQTMGSFGRKFKLILNQQDLTYYKYANTPSQLSWWVKILWRLYHLTYWPGRWTLNRADMVATVSDTSKKEIEAAKLTKRPIIVVPNAARDLSAYLDSPITQKIEPPKNLVYMGSFIPYKNVETLISLLSLLPDFRLHLLSRISPERKTQLLDAAPKAANITFHGGVSDQAYAKLLADNAIMVNASQSEGFNLNLAEALKAGTPCVVSDIPVHHEVAGEGALFADPNSPDDFANKIRSLDDITSRQKLVHAGQVHIDTFSWQKSANILLNAAKQLSK